MPLLTIDVAMLVLQAGALMPHFERAVLKEILVNRAEHDRLLELHSQTEDADKFRAALMIFVVQRIVDASHQLWEVLFEGISTEKGKQLAQIARERRAIS